MRRFTAVYNMDLVSVLESYLFNNHLMVMENVNHFQIETAMVFHKIKVKRTCSRTRRVAALQLKNLKFGKSKRNKNEPKKNYTIKRERNKKKVIRD